MWMIAFMLLPLLGLAYVGWHIWLLLPLKGVGGSFQTALQSYKEIGKYETPNAFFLPIARIFAPHGTSCRPERYRALIAAS